MSNKKFIIIFALIFCVFAVGFFVINNTTPDSDTVQIKINGELHKELDINKDGMFVIKTDDGHSIVNVKNKEVFVVEATCPDKLCVRHGKLLNKYDSIVCLPNKIVIEYKNKSSDIDAVTGR